MPEVAVKKFKFVELVPKGKGHKTINGSITCTANGAVEIMNLMWLSGRFAIDPASCKKNLTPNQQREAFGLTIAEMEKESAPATPVEVEAAVAEAPAASAEPITIDAEFEVLPATQDDPLLGSKSDHEKHMESAPVEAESNPDAAEPA